VEVERLKFVEDVFASKLALANAKTTLSSLFGLPQANPLSCSNLSWPGGSISWRIPRLAMPELERRLAKRPDLMASMFEQSAPIPRLSISGRYGLQTSQSQAATRGIWWTTPWSLGLPFH
jgi:hypothetical protein